MCSLGGAALELRTASAGTCHATGADGIRVCFEETSRDPGGGYAGVQGGLVGRVELQPLLHAHRNTTTGADDLWWLLRVSGPHPQTVLFDGTRGGAWVARFRMCSPGVYTLYVREVLRAPWAQWRDDRWEERPGTPPCAHGNWTAGVRLRRYAFRYRPAASGALGQLLRRPASCSSGLWAWSRSAIEEACDPSTGEPSGRARGERARALSRALTLLEEVQPVPYPEHGLFGNANVSGALAYVERERSSDGTLPYLEGGTLPNLEGDVLPNTASQSSQNCSRSKNCSRSRAGTACRRGNDTLICLLGDSQMRTLADGLLSSSAMLGNSCAELEAAADMTASMSAEGSLEAVGSRRAAAAAAAACTGLRQWRRLCPKGTSSQQPGRPKLKQMPCPKNAPSSAVCQRSLCDGVRLHYLRVNYGDELISPFPHKRATQSLAEHAAQHCTAIVLNTGQWCVLSTAPK